jgi:hypothetical protein
MKKPIARVNVTVALSLEEHKQVQKLQAAGVKVVDIFRAGIEAKSKS